MDEASLRFLLQLRKETGGNPSRAVSLYEVGLQLGWERPEALKAAENLMAEGLVEVRSLSGAIAISRAGLSAAEAELAAEVSAAPPLRLGPDPILDGGLAPRLRELLAELRLRTASLAAEIRGELEADLRTIEAQLGSPRPKTAILREVFRSLAEHLGGDPQDPWSARLRALIED
ncbi:MAG: hypothetical protein WHT06_11895 [Desulfobacterales bacterium]